ncbi:hypothetical protein IJG91_02840 [Candidatus Saccharibacteria bacterium]|nr:hypothetical protein [Candidatus Saccharibacteria bacterium]
MKEKLKTIWKKSIPYLVIAVVALISMSIFIDKDYIQGHDFYYHAATAEGMANGSVTDIFTGKIYGVLSNELGNGEGLFYPQLSHIGAALIFKVVNRLGIGGIYLAMRISYFLIIFFAGVFMRKFILLVTKNKKAAMASAIFYMTFPYFLIDMIVRSAMAEATFFIFMPIVLIGLYHLIHDDYRKFLIYFTIGCVGMVHSHLVMTLFFVGLTIIGFLPNIKSFFKKKRILYFLLSALITALISLPFLLPMLENKAHADYRVFEENFMANINGVEMWRVPISQYFSMNGMILNVPIIITFLGLIAVIYAIFRYKDIKTKENKMFLMFALIITIISFFCTTTLFSWRGLPNTLLMLQFPWRLLTFVGLGSAIIIGFIVAKFKNTNVDTVIIILIAISGLFGIARVNTFAQENLKAAVPAGELHHTSSIIIDYLPTANPATHTNTFINDYPSHDVLVAKGNAKISDITNRVPDMSFTVSDVDGETTLTLPRIYYLGYKIEAKYPDGSEEELPYLMSELGFIDITINKNAEIKVTYPGTRIQRVSYWVSGITIIAFTGFCIYLYKKEKKK